MLRTRSSQANAFFRHPQSPIRRWTQLINLYFTLKKLRKYAIVSLQGPCQVF